MNAYVLRVIIEHAVKAHPDVVDARPTTTVYSDRLALAVEDRDGRL